MQLRDHGLFNDDVGNGCVWACCARQAFETDEIVDPSKRHMMRAMLAANLVVDQRFANGTQGRIMMFNPKRTQDKRAALPSCHRDLMARFLKETSVNKRELFPDIDHIDVQSRPESLRARGEPVLLQLSLVPCYALTIHKTQSLSITPNYAYKISVFTGRDSGLFFNRMRNFINAISP